MLFRLNLQLFAEEKTEAATPHKRQEVRKKGQVAKSGELGTAAVVLTGFFVIKLCMNFAIERFGLLMQHLLSSISFWQGDQETILSLFILVLKETGIILLPIFGALLVISITANLVQVGFMFNMTLIQPQLNRINPLEGFKRIFSRRALIEFLKSMLKVIIIGWIVYAEMYKRISLLANLSQYNLMHTVSLVNDSVFDIVQTIGLLLLLIALVDYLYQRWEFEKSIRMTKQELKEDYKQTEGDPKIRSRIRQRQRELASRRMMQAVPKADVVITNPTHFAVALLYDAEKMAAPEVVAKGTGVIAQKIKEIAKAHNVPMVENPPLAQALYKSVEIGQQIPAELYSAVAEVLAFVYRLRNRSQFTNTMGR